MNKNRCSNPIAFLRKAATTTLLTGAFLLSGTVVRAQYCASSADYTADEDIFNVTLGTFSNTSDCSTVAPGASVQNEYSDYTSLAGPTVLTGSTVPMSIEIGTCNLFGSTYDNMVALYIDFDHDGTYSSSEQVYISPTYTDGPHIETANIAIPASAVIGQTGMRVICIETEYASDFDGCADYGWGETEDYTINILPPTPPNCVSAPITPLEDDIRCTGSTTLRWNKPANATVYDVYLNTGSGPATTLVSANQTDTFYTFSSTANNYAWKVIPKNGSIPATGCATFKFSASGSVTPDVTITRSPAADTLCPGDTVTFSATGLNGGAIPAYQWMRNGSAVGANNPVYTTNALTATDTVYVVFSTSATGSCVTKPTDTSNKFRIDYRPAPDATIMATGSTSFCVGGSVYLSVASGASSYQWRINGNPLANGSSNNYTAQYTGLYTARVTGANGCTSTSAPVAVTSYPAPVPQLTRTGNVAQTSSHYATYQWYRNGVLIPGATSSSYNFNRDGSYTVFVTDSQGCSGTSALLPVNELSIGNQAMQGDLRIFPNPASSVLYIESAKPVNIAVLSIEGKTVLTQKAATSISIDALANGLYMVRLTDDAGRVLLVEKLLKSSGQ